MPKKDPTAYEQRICRQCGQPFVFLLTRAANGRDTRGQYCSFDCRVNVGRLMYTCAACGTVFKGCPSVPRKYCSTKCARTSDSRKTFSCEQCGVSVELITSKAIKRRFCSRDCSSLAQINRSPIDRALYCSKVWAKIRQRIVQRDGCCSRCRSIEDLIVHHIKPWRISRDNSDANLITLCRPCHALHHDNNIPVFTQAQKRYGVTTWPA